VQQEIGHDRAASLAARARQLRRTAGISFAAMAAEASVAKSTLHRWETAGPGRSARARHWLAVLAVLDATPGPHTVVAPTHRAPVRCLGFLLLNAFYWSADLRDRASES